MENYEAFKKSYFALTNINLDNYKEKQMKRRIETLIEKKGLDSFEKYTEKLSSEKNELNFFTDYITINVTEFFRTPQCWTFLEEKIIPLLSENLSGKNAENQKKLKIWSAGCSSGEEPYSLSMLFLKYFDSSLFKILATDLDENILKTAEKGIFSKKSVETIPLEFTEISSRYLEKFTLPEKNKAKNEEYVFGIKEAVKNQVEFRKMDMTVEAFPENCDFIICRNVLIYFTEEIKQKIFQKFYNSLNHGGILFLGHTEQIIYYKNFGFEKLAKNFYRKP